MSTIRKKTAALGFEPPPLGRGPDAIPLNQSGCKFGQVCALCFATILCVKKIKKRFA